jgi:peptidoglycan/LPS O-acetylase OafA/YrhL
MLKALPEARPGAARYVTLDGMRGLAAIAVALFHFDIFLVPHGYVAVDFFFVLSGFVLYRSYLPRWREGLGVGRFMIQRFARLYPLFVLGIMLGVALAIQQIVVADVHARAPSALAVATLFNGAMLPSPLDLPLYPLNVPAWSLFFEVVANLALIVVLFRLPRVVLIGICLVSAIFLIPIILQNGSGNIGALRAEYGIALLRTAFSFTLGTILAGLPEGHMRPSGWLGVFCMVAIGVLMAMPVPAGWTGAYDLLVILFFSPLLVFLGSRCEPVRLAAPLAVFTGEVSYALYAVHWTFIEPMRSAVRHLGLTPIPAAALFLTVMVTAAWAAVRWYDLPLRRRLTVLLRREARGARPVGA